jgi:hypothetical protein
LTLTHIANRFQTDKGTTTGAAHGYSLVYDMLFRGYQNRPINMLEIGLCAGGPEVQGGSADRAIPALPSISMWHEFLPQAKIYGLDISDCSRFETNWFKFVQADCGSREQLKKIAAMGVEFDIIIDDGSHASYHQQLTLEVLYPTLRSGGIYAIEDLDWQPSAYEAQLPASAKTTDYLQGADFGTMLLFGDDDLASLRKTFNKRSALKAPLPHYIDNFNLRGYARRVAESAGAAINSIRSKGNVSPRTKLAVIQKP